MTEYAEITIKNHKKYNKKIVFVIFNECYVDDDAKITSVVKKYHKIIEENKGICSIIDARNVKGCSKTLAFSKAKNLNKYEELVKSNLICMSILMENPVLKMLMDAVTKIHPFVVPTKVVKDNKSAMDFVIENIK
jgi:hypothetical protein